MSHHIAELHKHFYQNTAAFTPEAIEKSIFDMVRLWDWNGEKAIASNLDSRPRTINTLHRIYRQTLTLGYAPDPNQLRPIGLNLKLLSLRLDGFPKDEQSDNPDHYFEPMSSDHLDTHPIALVPADDSPNEHQATTRPAPLQPSDYATDICSEPGMTSNQIKWYFMEAPRENYCEALREDPKDPYAHFELIKETGWYSSDEPRFEENLFGPNLFGQHPIAAIPRRYADGQRWFVDKAFVCPPTDPGEYQPHLSLIVCHDYQPLLHDDTNNIHNTLLHGEIKAIMQAMIARYHNFEWPSILEQQVIPIQVLSVIGERARILQAHFNGQELVVRRSLLFTPSEPGPFAEDEWYELFARYLAAKPVGNTKQFPLNPSTPPTPPPTPPAQSVPSRKEKAPRHPRPRPKPSRGEKKHQCRVQKATKSPTRRPVQHHTPSTSTRFDTVVGDTVPPRKRKRNTQEDDDDKNNNNDNNKHRDKRRPHPARDCW
ncbi:hypothetical protein BJX68DRAFT_271404 [Aspergillus pseudodeflectus]|uniref:HNH nuclease domain-containing protein n=1 Tax=Aspergillus pseudodeflectus TaxID=176178 RepID=A0ABR4JLM4_9EURO